MVSGIYIPLAASVTEWMLAFGLLVAVLVGVFVAVVLIQRHTDPRRNRPTALEGGELTTDAIERMRDQGTISQAEYEVMRQIVIGKTMARTRGAQANGKDESDADTSAKEG
jgi:hypothetical protein